jgi:group I intron endonuclease
MYGYVYKTTNLINNKIYIGQKVSSKFLLSYYGSGVILKRALKKYGKDNFLIEMLCECDSQNDLDSKEILFIDKYKNEHNEQCYNIASGSKFGGNQMKYATNEKIQEKNQKISIANKGKKAWNRGLTINDPRVKLYADKHKGFTYSEASLEKMSISAKIRANKPENVNRMKNNNPAQNPIIAEKISKSLQGKMVLDKNPNWNTLDENKIKEMYFAGYKIKDIANYFEVGTQSITRRIKKLKLAKRLRSSLI